MIVKNNKSAVLFETAKNLQFAAKNILKFFTLIDSLLIECVQGASIELFDVLIKTANEDSRAVSFKTANFAFFFKTRI